MRGFVPVAAAAMAAEAGTPQNLLSVEAGAAVLVVSHEATQLGSAASNLLVDREDHLWIAERPPQHVTFSIGQHESIRYIGWYVWHDYLTNPKVVEISSGSSLDTQHVVTTCTAFSGSGVQLWELAPPISRDHHVITFKVLATFGGSYTYMNRVYAFTQHPGSNFVSRYNSIPRSAPRGTVGPSSPGGGAGASDIGSPFHMSALLRDLDEDIRSLHPLRTNAQHIPELSHPTLTPSRECHAHGAADRSMLPQTAVNASSEDVAAIQRIGSLESSLTNLARMVELQANEIRLLRAQLATTQQPRSAKSSTAGVVSQLTTFPEEALRNYVEDVVAPKLARHSRRLEARVTQTMNEHLEELLRTLNTAVEEQVTRHMRKVALSVDESFRHLAKPVGPRRRSPAH